MKTVIATALLLTTLENIAIARDGDAAAGFGSSGWSRNLIPSLVQSPFSNLDLHVQSDGRIIIGGTTGAVVGGFAADFMVARLTSNGTIDPGFGAGGRRTIAFDLDSTGLDGLSSVTVRPNGRIVACGSASAAEGTRFAIAQLTANGSLDTGFGTDGRVTIALTAALGYAGNALAFDCAVDSQGRLVVAGTAQAVDGALPMIAIRLHPDGGLDSSFGDSGVSRIDFNIGDDQAVATAIAILPDGRPLLAGHVSGGANDGCWLLARLTDNGTPDASFGTGGQRLVTDGAPGYTTQGLWDIEPLADGSFVISGGVEKQSSPGDSDLAIAKFLANGTDDPTFGHLGRVVIPFDLGGWENRDLATALVRDTSGRISVVGSAAVGNSGTTIAMARVLSDGALDPSFGNSGVLHLWDGSNTTLTASAAELAADGQLLIFGSTTETTSPTFVEAVMTKRQVEVMLRNGFESR